ncbi:hypothetical protein KFE25_009063 [Diacronema lutheri]|uniref:Uncharacterized protein n=2 Tax=Diacronema lutheri TaxID=2081491 RepID=A0A8J5XY60_DIALT|nr:hypothetical protein KFE25_009063 [Diacronema lutheri]
MAGAAMCAPRRIAFVLAGAVYTVERTDTVASFAQHVVNPLGTHAQSAVFVNLVVARARGSNARADHAGLAALVASLRAFTVQLGGVSVRAEDATEGRFAPEAPARCAWGCARRPTTGGRDAQYCAFAAKLVTHWWGRMALAWDMITSWEREAGRLRFESVLLSRPDLVHTATLDRPCAYDTTRYWYSAISPPDALWYFSRPVARDAMNTIRLLVRNNTHRCSTERPSSYAFSWFALCHWARQRWGSGLRVRLFEGVRASVVVRQGSAAVRDVNAGRSGVRKPDGYTLSTRPSGLGGMHCGWF